MYLLRSRRLLYGLITTLLMACAGTNGEQSTAFYDLDSLIDVQVAYLSKMQPALQKEAEIDGKLEVIRLTRSDSAGWARELEIFRQLDLNAKKLNATRYEIRSGLHDNTSNLNILEYRTKEADALPLSMVRIYYQEKPENIRKIEGTFNESNGLYSSSRYWSMELIDIRDTIVLTNYAVTGSQKMIFGDSVKFKIRGTLSYE
jgi:hypothetical protein